jgi:hypothetical protein
MQLRSESGSKVLIRDVFGAGCLPAGLFVAVSLRLFSVAAASRPGGFFIIPILNEG